MSAARVALALALALALAACAAALRQQQHQQHALPPAARGSSSSGSSSSTAHWMADHMAQLGNLTLLNLTLPGTHDSGSYWLSDDLAPGNPPDLVDLIDIAERFHLPIVPFIRGWAVAQNTTFFEQLEGGIRYIDLRACWTGTEWHTFHFLLGNTIQLLLNDVAKFVAAYPTEVIVVEASHFWGSDAPAREQLAAMIEKTLGASLVPRATGFATLAELVAQRTTVHVLFDDADICTSSAHPALWCSSGNTEGSYANTPDLSKMWEWDRGLVMTLGYRGALFELSYTLTTDAESVIDSVLFPHTHPTTLRALALLADAQLDQFATTLHNAQLGNILLVDHFDHSSVVQIAIDFNTRLCFDQPAYAPRTTSGDDCRSWWLAGQCETAKVRALCPLTCGLC